MLFSTIAVAQPQSDMAEFDRVLLREVGRAEEGEYEAIGAVLDEAWAVAREHGLLAAKWSHRAEGSKRARDDQDGERLGSAAWNEVPNRLLPAAERSGPFPIVPSCCEVADANTTTSVVNPAEYVTVYEVKRDEPRVRLDRDYHVVDSSSIILVAFDSDKGKPVPADCLRVVLEKFDGGKWTLMADHPNEQPASGCGAENANGEVPGAPKTPMPQELSFDLRALGIKSDTRMSLRIRVTHATSGDIMTKRLDPREFGWHQKTRPAVLMFVHRRADRSSADTQDSAQSGAPVVANGPTGWTADWVPSLGVNVGMAYTPRNVGPLQYVRPEVGVNVALIGSDSVAGLLKEVNVNHGAGPTGLGTGFYLALFNGVLVGTFGYNLTDSDHGWHWGVGLSLFEIVFPRDKSNESAPGREE